MAKQSTTSPLLFACANVSQHQLMRCCSLEIGQQAYVSLHLEKSKDLRRNQATQTLPGRPHPLVTMLGTVTVLAAGRLLSEPDAEPNFC